VANKYLEKAKPQLFIVALNLCAAFTEAKYNSTVLGYKPLSNSTQNTELVRHF